MREFMLLTPDTIKNLTKGKNIDMPSLINNELEKNSSSVSVFPIHEYWLDIGQIEDYQKAQVDFISNFFLMNKNLFCSTNPGKRRI